MTNIKVKLTYEEQRILIMGLVELKNHLIEEDRYTDAIDELIMKLTKYPECLTLLYVYSSFYP